MQPVLFSVFGLDIQSYGVSKALAALVAALLLGLTQPQLWALVSVIAGVVLIAHARHLNRPRRVAGQPPRDKAMTVRPSA